MPGQVAHDCLCFYFIYYFINVEYMDKGASLLTALLN